MRAILLVSVLLTTFSLSSAVLCAPRTMKTKVITLYDIGMMQVEKQVAVDGATELALPVSMAHLDDLLASLMVFTNGAINVQGVTYPTVQNLGQALASGSVGQSMSADNGDPAFPNALSSTIETLIGTEVLVKFSRKKAARGTVMGVVNDEGILETSMMKENDEHTRAVGSVQKLILVNPNGALSFFSLSDISSIEFVSSRESRALKSLASELARSNGFRETEVLFQLGKGAKGTLAAAYLQQIPKWRIWYRIIQEKDALWLEGWTQVHNDTSEDWEEVQMTLVSGLPKSYLVSAASPRYGEREVIELQNEGAMMPQLGALTADRILYDFVPGYIGLGMGGTGRGGGGYGEGTIGLGSLERIEHGSSYEYGGSSLFSVRDSAFVQQAEAAVAEEISTYRVLTPVNVKEGASAMVPVIRQKVDGKIFTRIDPQNDNVNICAYLANQTGTVLQYGLATVYVDGRFRGQGILKRTEPYDHRLLCYATDQDVTFDVSHENQDEIVRRVEWYGGEIFTHALVRRAITFSLHNQSGQERTMGLVVRHISNGRIVDNTDFQSLEGVANERIRFVTIPAREEQKLEIVLEEGKRAPKGSNLDVMRQLSQSASLPPKERHVLKQAVEYANKIERLRTRILEFEQNKSRLETRLSREKENLKSLPRMWGRRRTAQKMHRGIMATSAKIEALAVSIEQSNRNRDTYKNKRRDLLNRLSM